MILSNLLSSVDLVYPSLDLFPVLYAFSNGHLLPFAVMMGFHLLHSSQKSPYLQYQVEVSSVE